MNLQEIKNAIENLGYECNLISDYGMTWLSVEAKTLSNRCINIDFTKKPSDASFLIQAVRFTFGLYNVRGDEYDSQKTKYYKTVKGLVRSLEKFMDEY